ncbi:DUF2614 family zinc ribbon-containing protein [Rossellomorea aquimaris]|uniref:DUF2614 family zinc ribbon-containing protein n=1 Tax=Rossellomorea aquimaris TaxID=189382 RepID=UPI0039907EC6
MLGLTVYLIQRSYATWFYGNKGLDQSSKEVECPKCRKHTKRQSRSQQCEHCYTSF